MRSCEMGSLLAAARLQTKSALTLHIWKTTAGALGLHHILASQRVLRSLSLDIVVNGHQNIFFRLVGGGVLHLADVLSDLTAGMRKTHAHTHPEGSVHRPCSCHIFDYPSAGVATWLQRSDALNLVPSRRPMPFSLRCCTSSCRCLSSDADARPWSDFQICARALVRDGCYSRKLVSLCNPKHRRLQSARHATGGHLRLLGIWVQAQHVLHVDLIAPPGVFG